MITIFINLLLAVHILVCVLIVVAVLMQRPKNEGLGAAFGGGMTDSLFGAQTTNVLATITRWLGVLFFGLTLLLSALYARQGRTASNVQQKLKELSKPVVPEVDAKSQGAPSPETTPEGSKAPEGGPAKTATPEPANKEGEKAQVPQKEAAVPPASDAKVGKPEGEIKPVSAPVTPVKDKDATPPSPAAPKSPEAPKEGAVEKDNVPSLKVSEPKLNPAPVIPPPSAPAPTVPSAPTPEPKAPGAGQ